MLHRRHEGYTGKGVNLKALEYGKMNYQSYCPHGFGRKTPSGVPIICGLCDPQAYAVRMAQMGKKRQKYDYLKRVKAW